MGVGMGTPLAGLLWRHYGGFFEPAIYVGAPFTSSLVAILWAAIGLTFCYISSVPMLTIHTARVYLRWEWWLTKEKWWLPRRRLIALGVVLLLPSLAAYFLVSELIGCNAFAQKVALVALSVLVLFQASLVLGVLISPEETAQFYDKLSEKRTNHSDFVESYRHMREHGNSVLIVLGELFLTFCLWEIHPSNSSESSVLLYFGVILAIWLIPSGLVWMVGTQLERHLTEQN
jgi:hypothetical protein